MRKELVIDGAHGEGGGQILRTGLSLAAILRQTTRFTCIRAGRRHPGLAAQHLTSVRAAAALCAATVEGDALGSQELVFAPQRPVKSGFWSFDVAAAREGGSAGGSSLVLQTVLLPLALSVGQSEVRVQGGTHLPRSPPFDYLRDVWLPALRALGVGATVFLDAWGWFPVGLGATRAEIAGAPPERGKLSALQLTMPGPLLRITGRAVAANLPQHIPERMVARASGRLAAVSPALDIRAECVRAACPGAGIFLSAEYRNSRAGFSVLGKRGRPAEQVADQAVEEFLRHHASGAAVDCHLGDQLLLPLAFAAQPSRFTVEQVTRHLETNAWVIEQFGIARVNVAQTGPFAPEVTVVPAARALSSLDPDRC